MMKPFLALFLIPLLAAGCMSNRPVDTANRDDLTKEGTVTFSRPQEYTLLFGSYSQRDLFEITYENFSRNDVGQPIVRIGIRYRGPVSWTNWFTTAQKSVTISGCCHFYADPGAQRSGAPALYSTNHRAITIRLGETCEYQAVCPVKEAQGYQLVLSEQ